MVRKGPEPCVWMDVVQGTYQPVPSYMRALSLAFLCSCVPVFLCSCVPVCMGQADIGPVFSVGMYVRYKDRQMCRKRRKAFFRSALRPKHA